MKKIKVAQIGVGYWGPNLLRNLHSNRRFQVELVVDLSKERCRYVKSHYPGTAVSQQINHALKGRDVDAVVIATPAHTHFKLAKMFLESGKHVLVEKPMAMTVREINEIAKISKRKKLVAMAGHTFLFNPAVRYLQRLIDSGDLGDIRYIYTQRLSLGRIRSDVDALWNFAPHDVSIIQYLLGGAMPTSVIKRGMDYIRPRINDVAFMELVYPNKVMAHVHVSWLDPHKVRKMTVVGSKKMAVYDDVANQKIVIYDKGIDRAARLGKNMDFDDPKQIQVKIRSGRTRNPRIKFTEPLKVELNHFADCIQHGKPCLTGPEHAKQVIQILCR